MRSRNLTFTESARRKQIVEAAIEVIAELGYNQASVRKIADRVGIAMSVVMYHFGNKDELVAAIVAELYRSVIATMLPLVLAEETAAAQLAAHIRAHTAYMASHRSHQVALMEIAANYRSRDGKQLADLDNGLEPDELAQLAEVQLETILAKGVAAKEFRSTSTDALATAIRSAIGGAVPLLAANPQFDARAYGEELVTIFRLATVRQDQVTDSRKED